MFSNLCTFFMKIMNMSFHGNKTGDKVAILVLKTLEQNGFFLENSKYDYWIPPKKLSFY